MQAPPPATQEDAGTSAPVACRPAEVDLEMGKHKRPAPPQDRRPREERYRPREPESAPHDTYARTAKAAGTIVCSGCGVVYRDGRWAFGTPPSTDVEHELCPACQRIRDGYPAGTLRLPAAFLDDRDETVRLIRNAEEAERAEHPLERLMTLEDEPDGGLVVTTTGIHLARALANKLERRFHRQARIRYPEEEHRIQVDWEE